MNKMKKVALFTGLLCLTSVVAVGANVYWIGYNYTFGSMADPKNYGPNRIPLQADTFLVSTATNNLYQPRLYVPENETVRIGAALIACGSYQNTLVKLYPNSELAFDGTGNEVWVSQTGGYNTARNQTQFTLDNAKLTIGTKMFNIAGINAAAMTNAITLLNGSELALTNGVLLLHGGSYSYPYTDGPQVIIDVQAGTVFSMRNKSELILGRAYGTTFDTGGYGQGGILKINGGTFDAQSTAGRIIGFTNGGATTGRVEFTSGIMKFGNSDSALVMANMGTSAAIYRQTGGVFTNGMIHFEHVDKADEKPHRVIDISGDSVFWQGQMRFNTYSGNKNNTRAVFRIRGSKAFVSTDFYYADYVKEGNAPFIFQDYRLTGDAARGEFPVTRHYIRHAQWDAYKGVDAKTVWGAYRVSPEGGAQLLHTDKVDLLCRNHEGSESFLTNHTCYAGILCSEMWAPYIETDATYRRPDGTVGYTHIFGAKLRAQAELPAGTPLATPVVRGYVTIPTFRRMESLQRAYVRLELQPQGDETVSSVVRRMREEGGVEAVADATVSPYNVRIDLKKSDLAAKVSTDRMIFDFAEIETFDQAMGNQSVRTNALIRTACATIERDGLQVLIK